MKRSPHFSPSFVARPWRGLSVCRFDQGAGRDLAHRPQGGRTIRFEAPQGPAWALACSRHVVAHAVAWRRLGPNGPTSLRLERVSLSGATSRNVALAGVYTVAAGSR